MLDSHDKITVMDVHSTIFILVLNKNINNPIVKSITKNFIIIPPKYLYILYYT